MILLNPQQTASLKDRLIPDRPGPMVGLHVIHTGQGSCFVDQWPNSQIILFHTGGNYSLIGDPNFLSPIKLKGLVSGFLETNDEFLPALKLVFPNSKFWDRLVFEWVNKKNIANPLGSIVRPLTISDAFHLWGLSPAISWIHHTWGGPEKLAGSGYSWGTFIDEKLVSVVCTFFLGETHEDIGVVTEPGYQKRGFSQACVAGLCKDIVNRGHKPSWTTSPDNIASITVAQKNGFQLTRKSKLLAIGVEVPTIN